MHMAREKKVRDRKGPPVPIEMQGLPDRLRRAMAERDMDQPALSKKSGVSQPTISNLIRGVSTEGVTGVVVAHLALALDVPSGWLLTGEGDVIPRLVARAEGKGDVVQIEEGGAGLVPRADLDEAPAQQSDDQTSR